MKKSNWVERLDLQKPEKFDSPQNFIFFLLLLLFYNKWNFLDLTPALVTKVCGIDFFLLWIYYCDSHGWNMVSLSPLVPLTTLILFDFAGEIQISIFVVWRNINTLVLILELLVNIRSSLYIHIWKLVFKFCSCTMTNFFFPLPFFPCSEDGFMAHDP